MTATKTGIAANVVGIIVLLLGIFGINVDDETKTLLIGAAGAIGLIINQILIAWAQRQQPPEKSDAPKNSGFFVPQFATVLFIVCFAVLALPACTTLSNNAQQSKPLVQLATMKIIEADREHSKDRAARIRSIASDGKTFLDGTDVSVSLLEGAINARLAALDLQPSDRVLAAALVDAVVNELNARVGAGVLSPEQRVTVSQVLDWIVSATEFYP